MRIRCILKKTFRSSFFENQSNYTRHGRSAQHFPFTFDGLGTRQCSVIFTHRDIAPEFRAAFISSRFVHRDATSIPIAAFTV